MPLSLTGSAVQDRTVAGVPVRSDRVVRMHPMVGDPTWASIIANPRFAYAQQAGLFDRLGYFDAPRASSAHASEWFSSHHCWSKVNDLCIDPENFLQPLAAAVTGGEAADRLAHSDCHDSA